MSDKRILLRGLHRLELGDNNADFRATLSSLAISLLGKSHIEADAFADANLRKYWNWLLQELDVVSQRGIRPHFLIPAPNVYALACACRQMLQSGDDSTAQAGRLALSRPRILRQIDSLTNREYEALACVAVSAIGARHFELTPPGNEGGIDFIATISVKTSSHIFSAVGNEVRIVGQCKKYADPVAVERIEQFLQTMQNVRHRSDRVRKHIPSWFDEAKGPIVGWIVAHEGFQSGASDEAKKQGLVLSDSLDMAELLCQSDQILPRGNPTDRANHILSECRKIL